ncbi:MAG: M15 family metallopeptidase [Deltaproteobacteria bacterium]|nr:M15 family metallopeptidase [Deltaproteobacteria bacterium]
MHALALVLLAGTPAPAPALLVGTAADLAALRAAPPPRAYLAVAQALTEDDGTRMRAAGLVLDGCPVAVTDLARFTFTHHRSDGTIAVGVLVVHRRAAREFTDIFRDAYNARFPIHRAEPIERYAGDDDASMAANNTSAFNCRRKVLAPLPDGTRPPAEFSLHSWGTVVDLNPLENPYLRASTARLDAWRAFSAGAPVPRLPSLLRAFCLEADAQCDVLPAGGRTHLRRGEGGGVLTPASPVVRAFKQRGWRWGGDWPASHADKVRADPQHFEKTLAEFP